MDEFYIPHNMLTKEEKGIIKALNIPTQTTFGRIKVYSAQDIIYYIEKSENKEFFSFRDRLQNELKRYEEYKKRIEFAQ